MGKLDLVFGVPVTLIFMGTVLYIRNISPTISEDAFDSSEVEVMLSSMNTSMDPCDDFYEYACQGWNDKNPMPNYASTWSIMDKLDETTTKQVIEILEKPVSNDDFPTLVQAKNFYRKCVSVNEETEDSSDLQEMLNVLNKYGAWPILHGQGSWNSSKFNWINSTVGFGTRFPGTRILQASSFLFPSWANVTNTIILNPPSSSSGCFSDIPKLMDSSDHDTQASSTKHLIMNISKTFLNFQGKTNINETYLEEKAIEILNVDSDIFYLNRNKYDFYSTLKKCQSDLFKSDKCRLYDLAGLQSELDKSTLPKPNKLDIGLFLQAVYKENHTYFEKAFVTDLDYLRDIAKYLSLTATEEAIANYLHYQMVLEMIPLTGHKYLNSIITIFNNANWGVKGKKDRNLICASETKHKFFHAIGQAYVDLRGNVENEFEIIRQMFKNVKESIRNLVTKYTPLSNSTQSAINFAMEKTDLCLGYPSWMKENNSSKMQSYYKGLVLNKSETFLSQSMTINLWHTSFDLESYKKQEFEFSQGNYCFWSFFLGNVNAYNAITYYRVYLPFGIIQPPFFNTYQLMAFNYGTFGSVIGHEIVHGLLVPQLLELQSGEMTPLAECLMDQYYNFSISDEEGYWAVDGKRTLRENIPDNLGILAAYKAFQRMNLSPEINTKSTALKQFTDDQLFFLGFAQIYCENNTPNRLHDLFLYGNYPPRKFRVLGTLQNMKAFAKVWNCPIGSNMNPASESSGYSESPKCL